MKPDMMHKILGEHKELASLPQVISEVIKISRNPESSAKDISAIIMKDPNLTARLLRVVNSSYYSPVQPITTIDKAVMAMGTRAVTALALAASIYNMVGKVDLAINRKKFWRHSLETAMAAQAIANAVKYEAPEEAFVCGLLHDIGLLILEASFPDEAKKIWVLAETGESIVDLEQQKWGTDHARVGQFLLRQWGLPEVLSEAVGGHHMNFGKEDKHPYQRIILIVNLANRISRFKIGNVPPPEAKALEMKRILAGDLDLEDNKLAEIEQSIISDVVNESGFLEIDVGSSEELLKEANHLLYKQYLAIQSLIEENEILKKGTKHSTANDSTLMIINHCISNINSIFKNRIHLIKSTIEENDIPDSKRLIRDAIKAVFDTSDQLEYILREFNASITTGQPNRTQLINIREEIDARLKNLQADEISQIV
jgi:putative nucleotidyltransferase with HDIG domain